MTDPNYGRLVKQSGAPAPTEEYPTMKETITPIPTALEREWRRLDYVEGPPFYVDPVTLAIDARSYRRMVCAECNHRGHKFKAFHRGREYRLLCICRKCGVGVEA
jgi:hypothetical protein